MRAPSLELWVGRLLSWQGSPPPHTHTHTHARRPGPQEVAPWLARGIPSQPPPRLPGFLCGNGAWIPPVNTLPGGGSHPPGFLFATADARAKPSPPRTLGSPAPVCSPETSPPPPTAAGRPQGGVLSPPRTVHPQAAHVPLDGTGQLEAGGGWHQGRPRAGEIPTANPLSKSAEETEAPLPSMPSGPQTSLSKAPSALTGRGTGPGREPTIDFGHSTLSRRQAAGPGPSGSPRRLLV